jgi:hypothetical protein
LKQTGFLEILWWFDGTNRVEKGAIKAKKLVKKPVAENLLSFCS